jgi:hypothetical protein
MRTVILLEQAMNGFMVPCRFVNSSEATAHAIQVLYFSRPSFAAPSSPVYSYWAAFRDGIRRHRFIERVTRRNDWESVVRGVREWMDDSLMDVPTGGGDGVPSASYASWPAYVFDLFAEAGLQFSQDEIMEMPLKRLFQHCRLAARRVRGTALTNPSDEIAVGHLAEKSSGGAA